MRCVEGIGNLNSEGKNGLKFERTPGDHVLESDTVKELHDDVGFALLIAYVVNRADIRMIQSRRGLRLTTKTGKRLRVAGNFFGQELQRDEAVQARVLGLVHHSHAAAAKLFKNFVVGNVLANHSPESYVGEEGESTTAEFGATEMLA